MDEPFDIHKVTKDLCTRTERIILLELLSFVLLRKKDLLTEPKFTDEFSNGMRYAYNIIETELRKEILKRAIEERKTSDEKIE